MAIVDPRLGELIETLISSGADWLALEIMAEIRLGQPDTHLEDDFQEAREMLSSLRKRDRSSPPKLIAKADSVRHLSGDEQIRFAVGHVMERISQNIAMADDSLANLAEISGRSIRDSAGAVIASEMPSIELTWQDEGGQLGRQDLDNLKEKTATLRGALLQWLETTGAGESK
jgi:hypothetical protein